MFHSGKRVQVDSGDEQHGILPEQWLPDGSDLLFFASRPYHDLALMATDATTGSTRLVLNEEHPVSTRRAEPFTLLEDGKRFLRLSARTGWRHLYLYDVAGNLIRPLARGEFPVEGVVRVDESTGWVYFTARDNAERPYDTHLHRVNLAGHGFSRLTEARGRHEIRFAPREVVAEPLKARAGLEPGRQAGRGSTGARCDRRLVQCRSPG